jgi:hypothetical protein
MNMSDQSFLSPLSTQAHYHRRATILAELHHKALTYVRTVWVFSIIVFLFAVFASLVLAIIQLAKPELCGLPFPIVQTVLMGTLLIMALHLYLWDAPAHMVAYAQNEEVYRFLTQITKEKNPSLAHILALRSFRLGDQVPHLPKHLRQCETASMLLYDDSLFFPIPAKNERNEEIDLSRLDVLGQQTSASGVPSASSAPNLTSSPPPTFHHQMAAAWVLAQEPQQSLAEEADVTEAVYSMVTSAARRFHSAGR